MNRLMHGMALVSVFLLISGCEDKKAKEALESAKAMSRDAGAKLGDMLAKGKEAVVSAAKNQAADLDQTIIDFKQRAATLSGAAKAELEEGIKALESSQVSLKQKLEPLKDAGEERWKELAREIDVIVTQMRKTIADLRAKMK